jgi:virulence-associated protein VagC
MSIAVTVEIVETNEGPAVPLPEGFRFDTPKVSMRREGNAVILEPLKPAANWPEHFFDRIRIDDTAFTRPPQGAIPPAPSFD